VRKELEIQYLSGEERRLTVWLENQQYCFRRTTKVVTMILWLEQHADYLMGMHREGYTTGLVRLQR
jgi:hypothetical protein